MQSSFKLTNSHQWSPRKINKIQFHARRRFRMNVLFQITWIRVINLDEILVGIIDKLNVDWYIVIPWQIYVVETV